MQTKTPITGGFCVIGPLDIIWSFCRSRRAHPLFQYFTHLSPSLYLWTVVNEIENCSEENDDDEDRYPTPRNILE